MIICLDEGSKVQSLCICLKPESFLFFKLLQLLDDVLFHVFSRRKYAGPKISFRIRIIEEAMKAVLLARLVDGGYGLINNPLHLLS